MELKVGQVFLLHCSFCSPQKDKFFVLASIDPGPWFFLINSQPTPFQAARPRLMQSLVPLLENDANFLTHDSVLDCTQLIGGYDAAELETLLVQGSPTCKGRLDTKIRRVVRRIIEESSVLSSSEIEALLRVW